MRSDNSVNRISDTNPDQSVNRQWFPGASQVAFTPTIVVAAIRLLTSALGLELTRLCQGASG